MGFPDDADLGVRTEIQVPAWTDITADTRTDQTITITRGRSDYSSQVNPTSIAMKIRDPDGRYAPQNPTGPYYGVLGRNTPIRVSVAAGSPWLDLPASGTARVRATTPDTAVLDITGDLDVRFDVRPLDWNSTNVVELGGKWGIPGQRSWHAYMFSGFVFLAWTADGTTELSNGVAVNSGLLAPRLCLRATLDVNNGASGKTVRFYTGPTLSGPWTQLGTDQVSAGTTSIFNSTASLELGDVTSTTSTNAAARLYGVEVRNGIAGVIVANPQFDAQNVGTTAFTDSAGRAWTVTSGGITNRAIRGVVEVPSWPAEWGTSGRLVTVGLSGAGILRRLRQGSAPLDSTLRRRVASAAGLIAYWPMEDGQGAVQAYSPIAGIAPMRTTGLAFASDDSLGGSAALPQAAVPASLLASVPTLPVGDWGVEFVYRIDSVPASPTQMFAVNLSGGTAARVEFLVGTGVSRVRALLADGTVLASFDFTLNDFTGNWGRVQLSTSTSGGTVSVTAHWVTIGAANNWATTTSFAGTPGRIASLQGTWLASEFGTLRIGHVSVTPGPLTIGSSPYQAADTGFAEEKAAPRFVRLCAEEGVIFNTPYGVLGTASMGPQRPGAALDLLGQVQDADVGVLHEQRDAVSLVYRPRWSLYNQTPALVLDYAQQQVAPPLAPQDDDQQTRNDITINRPSGSSARAVLSSGPLSTLAPPSGVGRYTDSREINVQRDDQLPSLAGWLLHLGTYGGVRYPQVTIFLHRCPELIDDAREVDIGDRIQVLTLPSWLPPDGADLIVQGITETLGVRTWAITYTCTPAGPWTVGVVGDSTLGRVSPGGSTTLAAPGATATASSFQVNIAAPGQLWRTTTTNYPLDIVVAGERMTLTSVTGSSSPQTFNVTRSANGVVKALPTGAVVELAIPSVVAL